MMVHMEEGNRGWKTIHRSSSKVAARTRSLKAVLADVGEAFSGSGVRKNCDSIIQNFNRIQRKKLTPRCQLLLQNSKYSDFYSGPSKASISILNFAKLNSTQPCQQ